MIKIGIVSLSFAPQTQLVQWSEIRPRTKEVTTKFEQNCAPVELLKQAMSVNLFSLLSHNSKDHIDHEFKIVRNSISILLLAQI